MIIDSEEYVTTPISVYLENMLNVIGYQPIPLQFRPALSYILSNTFLLMVGALEKKLEMISWHIAHDDYDYRHKYICENNHITAKLSKINDIYKYLINYEGKNCTLMSELKYKNEAYDKIIVLFKNSNFINYTNSDFFEFQQKCLKLNKINELEDLYKKTIDYRHTIAHNINSVYKNHTTFSELNKNEIAYNWYARFMILLFVDCVFLDKFKEYNIKTLKIKW